MANDGLPAEWEGLSHSARVRRAIEIGRQADTPGGNIVPELLTTAEAAARLIERAGGVVTAVDFLVELAFLRGRQKLGKYPVFAAIQY